jgi:ankyrin repeat protein
MGGDVNAQNKYNDTPLHQAFFYFNPNGDITVLMYLLTQTNTNVNTKGYNGETLLHLACQHINYLPLDIFKVLIEKHGCDVNVQNKDNNTPLHQALRYFDPNKGGDIKVLHYLLSQKGVNCNIKGWNGYTLLHWACNNINNLPLDVFKLLIETHGADVNVQDKSNNTSVRLAFLGFKPRNGDITALAYLINQNNVNLNIKNEKGCNLLHTTCVNTLPSNRRSLEIDAEYDTVFCQIVEFIAERCVQEVFDEKTPLEATTM